jgi:hypothetical protein
MDVESCFSPTGPPLPSYPLLCTAQDVTGVGSSIHLATKTTLRRVYRSTSFLRPSLMPVSMPCFDSVACLLDSELKYASDSRRSFHPKESNPCDSKDSGLAHYISME